VKKQLPQRASHIERRKSQKLPGVIKEEDTEDEDEV
jgi:hypothetical protein